MEYHARVARVALAAASDYGFALAGGQALIAHGVVSRPTSDIDLFTDRDDGVRDAAETVAAALARAGFDVTEVAETAELFDGFDHSMAEFEIHDADSADSAVRLQLVRFDRDRPPVLLEIGPVLHLDDLIGMKVAALAARAEPRDFIDVAAALDRYGRDRLVALGMRADPALTPSELADAVRRLDRMPDEVFHLYGLGTTENAGEIAAVRRAFEDWPRH
ncbi:nucleotidyl transferase AbiEii/AbiGii toxin family protein [Virgisporangium aurantiacum]|uniref:Nucleotidyl transferase AbiEii toxin, Type IV TA system n=1 Tax=Virgisporangium aurantiacum TaxID=175570 RepID=A0A8J4DZE3_9ACTN|nr:nucleotidyl transferase AbiEii/AbiGii toxin family protein [Virgisporangium aurantiacum]GIJ56635.1 hypothetical protein Vau01_041510 [Virgisporangium aurantiacum]